MPRAAAGMPRAATGMPRAAAGCTAIMLQQCLGFRASARLTPPTPSHAPPPPARTPTSPASQRRWNGGTVERWNGGTVERWNGGTVEAPTPRRPAPLERRLASTRADPRTHAGAAHCCASLPPSPQRAGRARPPSLSPLGISEDSYLSPIQRRQSTSGHSAQTIVQCPLLVPCHQPPDPSLSFCMPPSGLHSV